MDVAFLLFLFGIQGHGFESTSLFWGDVGLSLQLWFWRVVGLNPHFLFGGVVGLSTFLFGGVGNFLFNFVWFGWC